MRFYLGESDDIALRYAAYHLSQAAEKICKACLKELGIPYAKSRVIIDLLVKLPPGQDLISDEWLDWLEEHASILFDWESKARYVEEYSVTRRFISKLYQEVIDLYETIEGKMVILDASAGLLDTLAGGAWHLYSPLTVKRVGLWEDLICLRTRRYSNASVNCSWRAVRF